MADILIQERLRTSNLFQAGTQRIHVNHPLHVGTMPLHDHDFVEIAMVVAGKALHRDVHGTSPLQVGDVIVLLPGQWHAYEQCVDLRLYNCCFTASLFHDELAWTKDDGEVSRLWDPGGTIRRLHVDDHGAWRDITDRCAYLQAIQHDPRPRHAAQFGALVSLLATLSDHARQQADEPGPERLDPRIRTVLRLLNRRIAHDWSLQELADEAGLERSYLGRVFRAHIGLSPLAYLAKRRAERAAVLLLTTRLSIAEVGEHVGYADPNYFARRFREAFQTSPSDYRRHLPMAPIPAVGDDWIQW